ncbi:tyrosine-type recombinase/integrase [Nocardia tengchongensis]|uniref:tyrosine-type recombinase/integrase n=1 Tax=Nocardia tengchongensis TaxID=2055889 RepID=UPI003622B084
MNRPTAARRGHRRAEGPPLHVVPDVAEPEDDELDARVAAYAAAADADNTVRTYTWAWNRFDRWCDEHGYTALPASTRVINRFLVTAADDPNRPASRSSLEVLRAAIAWKHAQAGLPDPTMDARARTVRRGINKSRVEAGETDNRAPAAVAADIEAMVDAARAGAGTWRRQVAARRDIALILLTYDFGRRRGEAAGLRLGDLNIVDDNPDRQPRLRIRLRGGKTHQDSTEYVYRPRSARDGRYCTWCALARWIAVLNAADDAAATARGDDAGAVTAAVSIAVQRLLRRDAGDPVEHCCDGVTWLAGRARAYLFRPVANGGLPHAPDTALSGRSVDTVVRQRALAAGIGPRRGHSLRAGVATQLFDDGATVEEVMALLGHKRPETSLRYDRRRAQRSADVDTGL